MAGSLPPTPNKATSQDLSLPPDVLAILDANRFFFKQPCKNPPILVDASSSKSISSVKPINLPAQEKVEEQAIAYDEGTKKLTACPKRVGSV